MRHLQASFACVVRFNGFGNNRARGVSVRKILALRCNGARNVTRRTHIHDCKKDYNHHNTCHDTKCKSSRFHMPTSIKFAAKVQKNDKMTKFGTFFAKSFEVFEFFCTFARR